MDDTISRKAVLEAIEDEWHGCTGEYPASTIINDTCQRIENLPPAEPQTEINIAYMRGKIDGINYCTERLRKMRMEVDNEQND